jgi:hypothetical protein
MFAKGHEQAVDVNPIFLRKFGFKGLHCLFGRGGFYISPAIGDAMDMYVHADTGLVAGDS